MKHEIQVGTPENLQEIYAPNSLGLLSEVVKAFDAGNN